MPAAQPTRVSLGGRGLKNILVSLAMPSCSLPKEECSSSPQSSSSRDLSRQRPRAHLEHDAPSVHRLHPNLNLCVVPCAPPGFPHVVFLFQFSLLDVSFIRARTGLPAGPGGPSQALCRHLLVEPYEQFGSSQDTSHPHAVDGLGTSDSERMQKHQRQFHGPACAVGRQDHCRFDVDSHPTQRRDEPRDFCC